MATPPSDRPAPGGHPATDPGRQAHHGFVPFDDPVQVGMKRGRRVLLTLEGHNTERLVFFSDAVFAIAITLLVLDLRVPEVPAEEISRLPAELLHVLPELFAFVLSFGIIASTWLSHFRRFRLINGFNSRLILANLVLLLLVALIPFPTALLRRYPFQPVVGAI